MKNIKYIIAILSIALFFSACEEDTQVFGDLIAPSNVDIVSVEIQGQDLNNPEFVNGDGSGFVTFKATASNVISYTFNFGDGSSKVVPSGVVTHRYTKVGEVNYTVTVSAIGTGGIASTSSKEVMVYSSFSDAEAENILSGGVIGEGKKWYWAADLDLHVGLGPISDDYGNGEFAYEGWWNAIKAWDDEKGCMYDNEFVFTKTANGITFEQTTGPAFIPGTYAGYIGVDGDSCHDETVATTMFGVKNVSLFPSTSKAAIEGSYKELPYRGTSFEISDGGFMGWYVGASTYDIISIDENYMRVRIIENTASGSGAAWYQLFTSTKPVQGASEFTNLVWSDEFETAGAPDPTKWTYDLGAGGWGNGEAQTYTDSADNVIVEDGVLKITAKKETDGSYTSARLKTQGLYNFKYGRVDISAKLPSVAGTWPALWMLGENFTTIGWPKCGEIDIMEQTGGDKANTLGTFHWWNYTDSANASYGESAAIANASSEFHLYSLEWTEESIQVFVDNEKVVEMANNTDLPFNENFFLIMNVAMGGSLGGTIDTAFTEDAMEVEYIKVYQ